MDPLLQPGDLGQANRYVYVGGDPVNAVDPTGLFISDPCNSIGLCKQLRSAREWGTRQATKCAKGAGLGAGGTGATGAYKAAKHKDATKGKYFKKDALPAVGYGCVAGVVGL